VSKEKRFEKVYSQGGLNQNEIWTDTETGVQYLFHCAGYAGGMCVLVDAEGKPILYRDKSKYSPEI